MRQQQVFLSFYFILTWIRYHFCIERRTKSTTTFVQPGSINHFTTKCTTLKCCPAASEIVERVRFWNSFPKSFPRGLCGGGGSGCVIFPIQLADPASAKIKHGKGKFVVVTAVRKLQRKPPQCLSNTLLLAVRQAAKCRNFFYFWLFHHCRICCCRVCASGL